MDRTTPHSLAVYNPASLSPDDLLGEFVAREDILQTALDVVRSNARGESPQHLLFIGPRGMGKTTMLLAIAYSVQRDPELAAEWAPVIFPEESHYTVADLADFWLRALEYALPLTGESDQVLDDIVEQGDEGIEARAREAFLGRLDRLSRRGLLFIENLGDFFGNLNTQDQHRLREVLMEDDRLVLIGSATSYFEDVRTVDRPFFDFFRTFRLDRFTPDEVRETLRRLAASRKNDNVIAALKEHPERVESMRVLTGGNPRLVKFLYRVLEEGASPSLREDLDRLLDDCTPYFKHRIESLSDEQKRVLDRVARQWDPVAVSDIAPYLRRDKSKISTYLGRLVDEGFLEEAPGSTPKRKRYQVAERFYNIYYLMRFSRQGRKRLEWLTRYMEVLYSEDDFRAWTSRTLEEWSSGRGDRNEAYREDFLQALTSTATGASLRRELIESVIETCWESDQLQSLSRLLDSEAAAAVMPGQYGLIEWLASLSEEDRSSLGYDPRRAFWWIGLTDELEARELFDHSEMAYMRALEIDPKSSFSWHRLAWLRHVHLQDFGPAEEAYRRALELDPSDALLWNNLGNLLKNHYGRHREAERAYRKAIELDPTSATPWNGLGNLMQNHLGQNKQAEEAYRKAIELDPSDAYPWNGLGNLMQEQFGQPEEAEKAFRRAIELDPSYTPPWNGLGNLMQYVLGNHEEAEKAYRSAIDLESGYGHPHAGLAALLSERGDQESADRAGRKAVRLSPRSGWCQRAFLTACATRLDAWEDVLPSCVAALADGPEGALEAFVLRGVVHLLTEGKFKPQIIAGWIEAGGEPPPLEDLRMALACLEEPSLLDRVAPERRTAAIDLYRRIGAWPDGLEDQGR